MFDDLAEVITNRFNDVNNVKASFSDRILMIEVAGISKIYFHIDIMNIYVYGDNMHISNFYVRYDELTDIDLFVGAILCKRFYDH